MCHNEIEVLDEYEPNFNLDDESCRKGMAINPVFCDECEEVLLENRF